MLAINYFYPCVYKTKEYDRGDKFLHYKKNLCYYLLFPSLLFALYFSCVTHVLTLNSLVNDIMFQPSQQYINPT